MKIKDLRDIDKILDHIYDIIDDSFLEGDFDFVDRYLEKMYKHVSSGYIDILIGILTVTAPAKSKLTKREDFYKKVEYEIKLRHPDCWEDLLVGLK